MWIAYQEFRILLARFRKSQKTGVYSSNQKLEYADQIPLQKCGLSFLEEVGIHLKEAANHSKLAADQGNAYPQFDSGFSLDEGRSVSIDLQKAVHYSKVAADQRLADAQYRYGSLAPERYDGACRCASDVFAFGLILFAILTGRSAFQESLTQWQIRWMVAIEGVRPEIPDSVLPPARALIEDCWADDPDDRPTFEEIGDRLAEMQFRVTADVNSAKVAEFVKRIEDWEKQNRRE
jgi:TPR repeat protein